MHCINQLINIANLLCYNTQFGEQGSPKSFIVHIIWTENYPEALPEFDLDAFYNNHL